MLSPGTNRIKHREKQLQMKLSCIKSLIICKEKVTLEVTKIKNRSSTQLATTEDSYQDNAHLGQPGNVSLTPIQQTSIFSQ